MQRLWLLCGNPCVTVRKRTGEIHNATGNFGPYKHPKDGERQRKTAKNVKRR